MRSMSIFDSEEAAKNFINEMLTWDDANPEIKKECIYEDIYGWVVEYDGDRKRG